MKKAILASVFGMAVSAFTAYADGHILFNNYDGLVYNPVVYGDWYVPPGFPSPGPYGKNVDDPNVELQLFYAYGTYTDWSAFMAAATPGVTTFIDPNLNPTGDYGTATSKGSPGGFYFGPDQVLPGWQPGETVTFMVEAWETSGAYGGSTYATSLLTGQSGLWTETGGATFNESGINLSTYPSGNFAAGPPVLMFAVLIPEPATLALGGLGVLSLLAFARRKKVLASSPDRLLLSE